MGAAWVKYDAGQGLASDQATGQDCQVRALCTALDITYADAWVMLYDLQGKSRACSFQLVRELKSNHSDFNVVSSMPFPAKRGKPRMTGTMFCKKYKHGRFILRMAHHVAAVIHGRLYDTWDSTSKCVYHAWEIRPR